MQNSPGAVVELQQAVAVVVHPSALNKCCQVRTDMCNLQPCDILGEILSVGADVTNTAGAALLRVGSPGGLLLTRLLQRRSQPALWLLHHNLADFTKLALINQIPGQLDHWVSGVIVHQSEHLAGLLRDSLQGLCLCHV